MMQKSRSSSVLTAALLLTLGVGLYDAAFARGLINVTPPVPSQGAIETGERPVTFSPDQADAGRAAYARYCTICHGRNLNDGEFGGPPLVGSRFEATFGGLPVSALYGYIEAAMPPDRPGRISVTDRTNIVAYLLSRNGYSTGPALPQDIEAMDLLMLEK